MILLQSAWSRRRIQAASISLAIIILLILWTQALTRAKWMPVYSTFSKGAGASNGTLGFGAIYVITEDESTWRVQGLQKAASLVGLQLEIHKLARPSAEEVLAHLAGHEAEPGHPLDATRLTLHYITILERFLQSGKETLLTFEDDVDFGLFIREQMQTLSNAIWSNQALMPFDTEPAGDNGLNKRSPEVSQDQYPYGKDNWDILWLGHYGFEVTGRTETYTYNDSHALPWSQLHSPYNKYYSTQQGAGQQLQLILRNVTPMTSYALAFTRSHAEKLVKKLRDDHAQLIDLSLHFYCQRFEQRCVVPAPELFHHHRVMGQKRIDDNGTLSDGKHDLNWWRENHKYTYNIRWSARCNALQGGERLGDMWQCMPGRYDDLV